MTVPGIGHFVSPIKTDGFSNGETAHPAPAHPEGEFSIKKWHLIVAGLTVATPLAVWLGSRGRVRRRLTTETEVLREALSKISPPQIREDVTYLASDALKGRGTPSEGLAMAGEHVKKRLQAHGWEPGGPQGYEYEYELIRARLDLRQTVLNFTGGSSKGKLRLGVDYYYGSLSTQTGPLRAGRVDLRLENQSLVYGGQGLKEDLASIDVKGKWLVCEDTGILASERRRHALEAGARGIVLLPPKGRLDPRYLKKLETRLKMARSDGEVVYSPHFPLDEVVLSPKAAEELRRTMGGRIGSRRLSIGAPLAVGRYPLQLNLTRKGSTDVRPIEWAKASNYVGFLPGTDPAKSQEVIVISAHLDHLGERFGRIYPGADDNASGSSALLALAEALPKLRHDRSILLLWTTGEELGLLGSEAWVRNPWLPGGRRVVANINIDMVGRNAADELLITPTSRLKEHYNGIVRRFEAMASQEGITTLRSGDEYWRRSDHYQFASVLKVPVAFITNDTHPDYHKTTDIAAKVNPELIARRTRLVLRVLDDLRGSLE